MRRTRRSGGRPPKKSSAERIHSAKKGIQRRRGTRVAHNAALIAAARMKAAEEAARQQAIADAEAEAQRAAERAQAAAAEAQRAAQRLEELHKFPNASFKMKVVPVPEFLKEKNLQQQRLYLQRQPEYQRMQEQLMNQGFMNQERFVIGLTS